MKKFCAIIIFLLLIGLLNEYYKGNNDAKEPVKEGFRQLEFAPYNLNENYQMKSNTRDILDKSISTLEKTQVPLLYGYDRNRLNIFEGKYWEMKDKGFSDIFNYDDNKFTSYEQTMPSFNREKRAKIKLNRSMKIPNIYKYENKTYEYVGVAYNPYYNQYYIVYENYLNGLYEYLLVKKELGEFVVSHNVGPRTKINYGDNVYLSYGVFQLGPLNFKNVRIN